MMTISLEQTLLPFACSTNLTNTFGAYMFKAMPFGLNVALRLYEVSQHGGEAILYTRGLSGSVSGRLAGMGQVSRAVLDCS